MFRRGSVFDRVSIFQIFRVPWFARVSVFVRNACLAVFGVQRHV